MHANGSCLGSLGCSWAQRASFGLTGNFFSFVVSSHPSSIRSFSVGRPMAGQIFRAPHVSALVVYLPTSARTSPVIVKGTH